MEVIVAVGGVPVTVAVAVPGVPVVVGVVVVVVVRVPPTVGIELFWAVGTPLVGVGEPLVGTEAVAIVVPPVRGVALGLGFPAGRVGAGGWPTSEAGKSLFTSLPRLS